jgi:hopanoid C-2 methylase
MQPITGLHIGSFIDPLRFDIVLYHEDWQGPFDPRQASGYTLAFLTGLQPDFDRMRQLSYFFRRAGTAVIAGGSICTQFPEFASQFFDVVCAGGVETVADVMADFADGRQLQPIYRSPIARIGSYQVKYDLFRRSRINPKAHLLEASRGCSFRCGFCVIPPEVGGHAAYDCDAVVAAVDGAINAAPFLSFRRWYPVVLFLDNNFSDNRAHMLAICEALRQHRRVRMWGALVTQNILRDHALIRRLAASKCRALFVGLESLDRAFLARFNKTQNLGRRNIVDDIAFAEAQGMVIGYGYLFDPRFQTVSEMEQQLRLIGNTDALSMPIYLSLVAPLAGTETFWQDLRENRLAANLRLRDLDGETIAYATLADSAENVSRFVQRLFRRPWEIVGRRLVLRKIARRILAARTANPVYWYIQTFSSLHCFVWARAYPSRRCTHMAGENVLDPQYGEYVDGVSEVDLKRYFEPVALTDATGRPAEWLEPYLARRRAAAGAAGSRPHPAFPY